MEEESEVSGLLELLFNNLQIKKLIMIQYLLMCVLKKKTKMEPYAIRNVNSVMTETGQFAG